MYVRLTLVGPFIVKFYPIYLQNLESVNYEILDESSLYLGPWEYWSSWNLSSTVVTGSPVFKESIVRTVRVSSLTLNLSWGLHRDPTVKLCRRWSGLSLGSYEYGLLGRFRRRGLKSKMSTLVFGRSTVLVSLTFCFEKPRVGLLWNKVCLQRT